MHVAWLCEKDRGCRVVLAQHWPGRHIWADVRDCHPAPVDLICGGFPCNDISRVGRRAGIDGEQSGLWAEFYRVVCEIRPRYVLVENSTSLCSQGLDRILGQLAQIGYDTEWDCLPAAAFGAPHIRDRLYLLAYPRGGRRWTSEKTVFAGWSSSQLHAGWGHEPEMARVADGFSYRLERKALGNAVVPQVAEYIGRRIVAAHNRGA